MHPGSFLFGDLAASVLDLHQITQMCQSHAANRCSQSCSNHTNFKHLKASKMILYRKGDLLTVHILALAAYKVNSFYYLFFYSQSC